MTKGIVRQVKAILESNGLAATNIANGVALRYDSAIVQLTVSNFGSQRLIQIRANVLSSVQADRTDVILSEVNRLNCETTFGKWAFYSDDMVIALEYDLLGDSLQEAEVMTSLQMVARLADHHDDHLRKAFGGLRAIDR